ncbi:MAG: hypothetical protein HYR55_11225 [Acidobacteria bacterium]|nr:hypothetical protein [Acidobacteriota bacterium]
MPNPAFALREEQEDKTVVELAAALDGPPTAPIVSIQPNQKGLADGRGLSVPADVHGVRYSDLSGYRAHLKVTPAAGAEEGQNNFNSVLTRVQTRIKAEWANFDWKLLSQVAKDETIFDFDLSKGKPITNYRIALIWGKEQDLWFHFHLDPKNGPLNPQPERPGFLVKLVKRRGRIIDIADILLEPGGDYFQVFVPIDHREILPKKGIETLRTLIRDFVLSRGIEKDLQEALLEINAGKELFSVLGKSITPGEEDLYQILHIREIGST